MVLVISSNLIFIFILFTTIFIPYCFSVDYVPTSTPIGFSSHIININSRRSPFHNPNLTRSTQIKAFISHSFARFHYIQNLTSKKSLISSIEEKVWPVDTEYVIEYYIGTPPIRTYAMLNTASSLTWLQCLPCEKCFNQSKVPIFDPSRSSSYKPLSCKDFRCLELNTHRCGAESYCQYAVAYGDGSMSIGVITRESLHFHDGISNVTLEGIYIGCGHKNIDEFRDEGIPGLIGLGKESSSIITQLSYKKISYCFGDFDDPDVFGFAKFGEGAYISGYKTPITFVDNYPMYYLNLEGISVDNSSLVIPKDTFIAKENGGFFIDSGTTFTYLNKTVFDMLVGNLEKRMESLTRVVNISKDLELCYKMDWFDMKLSPIITFHLTGADLQLPILNTWINVGQNVSCLAMFPSDGRSILGNYQQQNVNIGYDLENNVVSFDMMYCND